MKILLTIVFLILLGWDLITGIMGSFWVHLSIIFFIWSYERILLWTLLPFVEAWNIYVKNYNNSYPVFSRFEIGTVQNSLNRYNRESSTAFDNYAKSQEKERRKGLNVNGNKSFSKNVKYYYKEYLEGKLWTETKRKELYSMIEGNIEVSLGKKTIHQVKEEVRNMLQGQIHKIDKEFDNEYKDWESAGALIM